jgi:hypothetical protein
VSALQAQSRELNPNPTKKKKKKKKQPSDVGMLTPHDKKTDRQHEGFRRVFELMVLD